MRLFLSEFERLIKRKSIWLAFLLIPFVCYGACIQLLKLNDTQGISSDALVSVYNFPVLSLQQFIPFLFNIFIIFVIALSVTAEYSSGEIRMVLIRPIKKENVFLCKLISIVLLVFLYLVVYLCCNYIVGYFMLNNIDKVMILDASNLLGVQESIIFTLKYYLTSFISLLPMIAVSYLIATLSKSVIVTLCTGIGFTLMSIMYSTFIQIIAKVYEGNMDKLKLLSLTEIQQNGVGTLLLSNDSIGKYIVIVMLVYFIIFIVLSLIVNKKKDQFV